MGDMFKSNDGLDSSISSILTTSYIINVTQKSFCYFF